MADEEVSSKSVSEVDEKRGERGGDGGGGGGGEGMVRVRSGFSEASEGGMALSRVRGVSEGEERRGNSETGETGGQHFILAVSVAPEGKGGPKRFAISCFLAST